MAAILFFAYKKFSPRVAKWHPPVSDSGHPRVQESTIKHHPYHQTRFSQKSPLGNWTTYVTTNLYVIGIWNKCTYGIGHLDQFRMIFHPRKWLHPSLFASSYPRWPRTIAWHNPWSVSWATHVGLVVTLLDGYFAHSEQFSLGKHFRWVFASDDLRWYCWQQHDFCDVIYR